MYAVMLAGQVTDHQVRPVEGVVVGAGDFALRVDYRDGIPGCIVDHVGDPVLIWVRARCISIGASVSYIMFELIPDPEFRKPLSGVI